LIVFIEPTLLHTLSMADSQKKYKYGIMDQGCGTALQLMTR